jgi:hypothetical protein
MRGRKPRYFFSKTEKIGLVGYTLKIYKNQIVILISKIGGWSLLKSGWSPIDFK